MYKLLSKLSLEILKCSLDDNLVLDSSESEVTLITGLGTLKISITHGVDSETINSSLELITRLIET